MPEIHQKALSTNGNSDIRLLYTRYSAMLFGYIIEVVKDHKLAEDYVVKVFCELSKKMTCTSESTETFSWNQLRIFAISILPSSTNSADFAIPQAGADQTGKPLLLNPDQEFVFNNVYYHGKSITVIAARLNRTEEAVRKILKDAFAAMKGNREN